MKARFFLIAVLSATLAGCGINSVPTAEENAKAKWANVQADYQRRADLIPNLVETVKGYATQEKEVLTQVTEARARAVSVQLTPEQLNDPAAVAKFQQAQGNLSSVLNGMRVTFEKYPDLKSNENFLTLQSQLEGTENRINVSIKDYNGAVQEYNTRIRTFPDMIGAKIIHGAKPMVPFTAQPGSDKAPSVKFGS